MSCDWARKLDQYVDAELPDSELPDMEAHLRTCPACASGALSRLQAKRLTQAAGRRYSPSPEFRMKVERSLASARLPHWARRWLPALAAAAALLVILSGAAIWLQHARGEQALGELADLHIATLASPNPVDVPSSDRHTVKPWFQGKLPFSFNLPDLETSQFRLIGGRLTYFQQNPGAQLLLESGKHRISVFIFQNRAGISQLNSGSALRNKLAFHSESWTEGGLWYFVVGDAGASDIHGLSELLRSAAGS
jgi:anti-sigma factor RsiW